MNIEHHTAISLILNTTITFELSMSFTKINVKTSQKSLGPVAQNDFTHQINN